MLTDATRREISNAFLAAASRGQPAEGIAWLVRKLAKVGDGLCKVEIELAGSFTRPIGISRGDVIRADFGPLGTISPAFAK